jgi:exosome complex RNA-binding protein Rrp42 (RNase PH superfamily)
MSQYSAAEKQFVQAALQSGLRTDGRVANQRRAARIESGILDNLAGSSHLVIDYDKCEIYTGVKLKLSSSNDEQIETKVFLEISAMKQLSKEEGQVITYLQELLQQHFIRREKNSFSKIVVPNSKRHFL